MNEIRATSIFNVFEIIFFMENLHDARDGDTPANK